MKKKHVPRRMCVVCNRKAPKAELLKLIASREGKILIDENNSITGKGIYICRRQECLKSFSEEKKFKRRYHNRLDKDTLEKIKGSTRFKTPENGSQG